MAFALLVSRPTTVNVADAVEGLSSCSAAQLCDEDDVMTLPTEILDSVTKRREFSRRDFLTTAAGVASASLAGVCCALAGISLAVAIMNWRPEQETA